MTTPIGPAGFVLRLLTVEGGTAGVGVLVSQSELLTCAHVVNLALGRPGESRDQPGHREIFEVCFPLLADRYPQRFRARVADWLPPGKGSSPGGDLTRVLLLDLIPEVKAAVRDRDLPARGRFVRVFGYPSAPNGAEGSWVEAEVVDLVGRQALRLETVRGSAVEIRAGFSGSPVVDRDTGLVLGLLTTAPYASSPVVDREPDPRLGLPASGPHADVGDRGCYAVTVEQIGAMWPGTGRPSDVGRRRLDGACEAVGGGEAKRVRSEGLVILHLSDPQFGPSHQWSDRGGRGDRGRDGGTWAGRDGSTLFDGLAEDLDKIGKSENLHPDLVVVTGGLTESGSGKEFAEATDFLARLAAELNLSRRRVVIVPGDHDVSCLGDEEHFISSERFGGEQGPPVSPRWEEYSAAFDRFYQGAEGAPFTATQPWALFEIPELHVVVAGLNSTMVEGRRKEDHCGRVGEIQLQWFADRLSRRQNERWIRIGAVHHSLIGGAGDGEDGLRDSGALDRSLGETKLLHVLLHGQAHDGRPYRLPSGLVTLSAGNAVAGKGGRPPEVVNRYQVLVLKRGEILRYARRQLGAEGRWIDDKQASPDGVDWRHSIDWTFPDIAKVFPHPGLDV